MIRSNNLDGISRKELEKLAWQYEFEAENWDRAGNAIFDKNENQAHKFYEEANYARIHAQMVRAKLLNT